MVEDAEAKGILKPGDTLIEPTSGNTGATPTGFKYLAFSSATFSRPIAFFHRHWPGLGCGNKGLSLHYSLARKDVEREGRRFKGT